MNEFDRRVSELLPLALTFARGWAAARFAGEGVRDLPRGEEWRVKVVVDQMVIGQGYVAAVVFDDIRLTISEYQRDPIDALKNLRWLLCGIGPFVRPSVARMARFGWKVPT